MRIGVVPVLRGLGGLYQHNLDIYQMQSMIWTGDGQDGREV